MLLVQADVTRLTAELSKARQLVTSLQEKEESLQQVILLASDWPILTSDWLIPILTSDWLIPILTSDCFQLLTTERKRRKETASVTKTGTLSSYDKRPAALVSQTKMLQIKRTMRFISNTFY